QEKFRENGAYDITFRCNTIDTVDVQFQIVRSDPVTGEKTPEKNAVLHVARDFNAGLYEWKKVITDENGMVTIRRASLPEGMSGSEPLVYYATSSDGLFSGVGTRVNADLAPDKSIIVELKPAVTIKGRFVDSSRKPVEGAGITISTNRVDALETLIDAVSMGRNCELFNTRPDEEGRFEAKGLLPNLRYNIVCTKNISTCDEVTCSTKTVLQGYSHIIVKGPGVYDMGDIICVNPEGNDGLRANTNDTASKNKSSSIFATTGKVDVAAEEAEFIAERLKNSHELSGTVFDSQGNPAKNASVMICAYGSDSMTDPKYVSPPVKTDENGKFKISTGSTAEDFQYLIFFVESEDGKEQAILSLRDLIQNRWDRLKVCASQPLDLKLSPICETKITVKNKETKPVSGATVQVALRYYQADFIAGTTDSAGEFTLKLPKGVNPYAIIAYKSNEGIDYITSGDWFDTDVQPMPEHVNLTFCDAIPRRVQIVDEQDQALVGLPLVISGLSLPNKSNTICVPAGVTDEQGIINIDFLPPDILTIRSLQDSITLYPQAFMYPIGFELRIPADKKKAGEVTRHILSRCGTISGRILTPDGVGVADLQIKASPSGNFCNTSFTDSEGRYFLRKMPNLFEKTVPNSYTHTIQYENGILVLRGPYAVTPWYGFDVKPGEKIENKDLQATQGTIIRVKIIVNDGEKTFKEYKESLANKPGSMFNVSLDYQYIDDTAEPVAIQGEESKTKRKYIYGLVEGVNDDGEATFRVPAGLFQIQPNITGTIIETIDGQKPESLDYPNYDFEITEPEHDGAERVIECRVSDKQQVVYTLRAVRADDPAVVLPGVSISVYPDDKTQLNQTVLTTDENGEAKITRAIKPITYLAFDKERNLGASEEWLEIAKDQTVIDIPMFPLVKAKGKLVDLSGKPFADKDFKCRMNRTVPLFDTDGKINSRLMIHDGDPISAKTDADGNFEIDGLVRKTEYDIMVTAWNAAKNENNNVIRHFFNTEDKEVTDLKTVK
ncbi:MAG: Ig-like domain-containing protein, partial [Thermoguttaceae bacterium]